MTFQRNKRVNGTQLRNYWPQQRAAWIFKKLKITQKKWIPRLFEILKSFGQTENDNFKPLHYYVSSSLVHKRKWYIFFPSLVSLSSTYRTRLPWKTLCAASLVAQHWQYFCCQFVPNRPGLLVSYPALRQNSNTFLPSTQSNWIDSVIEYLSQEKMHLVNPAFPFQWCLLLSLT